jgi:hypothetical protein
MVAIRGWYGEEAALFELVADGQQPSYLKYRVAVLGQYRQLAH